MPGLGLEVAAAVAVAALTCSARERAGILHIACPQEGREQLKEGELGRAWASSAA